MDTPYYVYYITAIVGSLLQLQFASNTGFCAAFIVSRPLPYANNL
jgi:hypothetical protein